MTSKVWRAATRKKRVEDNVHQLERVLSLKDLVVLGIGSTLGLGAYVLAGNIAKYDAGPAACLSYVFAAISAAISGLCYAEFAARVPKAGSAYVFCYASIGECVAFLVGWNNILGAILATAGVSKGLSGYIDSLSNKTIKTAMTEFMPIQSEFLSTYPDVLAAGLIIVIVVIFSLGVRASAILVGIFSTINVLALITAIIAGATKADIKNWNVPLDQIDAKYTAKAGSGGFLPFGIAGVMSGGTKCLFSYSGYDISAVTGAEAKNPKRDIPLSMMISLTIVFIIYFSISSVLTLATPYYLQDDEAPFATLFESYGWTAMRWIITVGAVCALTSTMMGCIFYLPRVLYAMANDGLLFKYFANVNETTKTTIPAIIIPGLISAPIAAFLNIDPLIDVITLQGLLQSAIIAMSILVLRYKTEDKNMQLTPAKIGTEIPKNIFSHLNLIFNKSCNKIPNILTSWIVNCSVVLLTLFAAFFSLAITFGSGKIPQYLWIFIITISSLVMLTMLAVIFRQPENTEKLHFKVPWVPFIPALSMLFNMYLSTQMSLFVFGIFFVWTMLGLIFYYFYGISHSEENPERKNQSTELSKL